MRLVTESLWVSKCLQGPLGAKDWARGGLRGVGGARCLYPPLEPSHKEVLWEGWIPSRPPGAKGCSGRRECQHQGQLPAWLFRSVLAVVGTPSWGHVESASGVRRVEGGRVGRGGWWSRLSVHQAVFLPGGAGRPLLQAMPDLQPQLHRVGQPRPIHPDLAVTPAL